MGTDEKHEFYFSAVVTVLGENESFARTVHFLRRGDSFGVST